MIRFTRGNRFYQIAPAYAGGDGYVGLCDGRVVARAADRGAVARSLITGANPHHPQKSQGADRGTGDSFSPGDCWAAAAICASKICC